MTTTPVIETKDRQTYIGIRNIVAMGDLDKVIPQYLQETYDWLKQKKIDSSGPPIVRYHSCPTIPLDSQKLDITVGWIVAETIPVEAPVVCDTLPPGQYASLTYTGAQNGIAGNGALVQWAHKNKIHWDSEKVPNGESFAGRVEYMIDGPEDNPDASTWRTTVSIKIKPNG